LVCLGHGPEGNAEINYELEVRRSEPGTLSLVWTAPWIRQLEGFEAKKFLFVPDADWGPSDVVSVTVSYW
jgi:E3 ubiquitin-protein ligase SIAH1